MDLGLPMETYHKGSRARDSYIFITIEMGNGVTGELVFKLPAESFQHMEIK